MKTISRDRRIKNPNIGVNVVVFVNIFWESWYAFRRFILVYFTG